MKFNFVAVTQRHKDTPILVILAFAVVIFVAGCPFRAREEAIIGSATADNPRPAPGTMQLVSVTSLKLREVVVRDYDFTLPLGSFKDFRFGQHPEAEELPGEIRFRYTRSDAPFVFLEGLRLPASDIRAMQVTLAAKWRTTTGETSEDIRAVQLFWARSQDISPGDTWPFNGRSLRFVPVGNDRPDTWVVKLDEHGMWNGTIDRMCIFVMASHSQRQLAQSAEGLNVYLQRIEFLGNRYRMPAPLPTGPSGPFKTPR